MGSAGATTIHTPSEALKCEPPLAPAPFPDDPPNPNPSSAPSAAGLVERSDDAALREAGALSREEVIRRRRRRARKLERYYRRQFWALMEEVRVRHRDYYWEHGISPFEEDEDEEDEEENGGEERENGAVSLLGWDGSEEGGRAGIGLGLGHGEAGNGGRKRKRISCMYAACKSKAMPLTRYCHSHILSDSKQTLYKPCSYVIKSAHHGPIFCQKPVLRAAVPSLCPLHFQKAQKHVSQALKKAGLNVSSSSRAAPKFHAIIAGYVHQIQAKRRKRREALNVASDKIVVKDEKVS